MKESCLWVWNCIDSSTNEFQLNCCHNLINLFRQMYTLEDGFGKYYDHLMSKYDSKKIQMSVTV